MEKGGKRRLDTLAEDANAFCRFLLENCSKLQDSETPQVTTTSWEELTAVFFPPNAITPFHEFTGTDLRPTVLISATTSDEVADQDGGFPVTSPDPMESLDASGEDEGESAMVEPFHTTWKKLVKMGQHLSNKRLYLTQSTPLHGGLTTQPHVSMQLICSHATTPSPVSLDRTRYLCSLHALGASRMPHPLPIMWVICHSETKREVVMGTSYTDSVLHTYTISEEEPLEVGPQSGSHGQQTLRCAGSDSWAFSEYEISSCSSDLMPSGYGQLVLQFAWPHPETLLCPPPDSANAVLRITATPGGTFSPVLTVYQELMTLLSLCEIALGHAQWPDVDVGENPEAPMSLASKVESFLEEAASPEFQPLEVTVISPTAGRNVYEPRTNLDFVERLWTFAKEVQSFDDLQEVFAMVFKAVLLGTVQPFLHRSSSSLLSSMFRQVLLCSHRDERQALAAQLQSLLSESKLLTCLVQAGVEKLQRDYRSFFVSSDLLTGSQLDQFFGSATDLNEQCCTLSKLHRVLELNAVALSFLNLPTSTLSSLTKVALEVYRTSSLSDDSPIFLLPLPAYSPPLKSVVALCSNLSPSKWSHSSKHQQHRDRGGGTALTVLQTHPLFTRNESSNGTGQMFRYRSCSESVVM